jgi:hypothetical protein
LHKAKKTSDTKDLNPSQKMLFELLLIDAEQSFTECIAMDANYLPAYVNKACALAIGDKPEDGLKYIEDVQNKIYQDGSADERASFEIVKAICLMKMNKKSEGLKLLQALKSTSSQNVSTLASLNMGTAPEVKASASQSSKAIKTSLSMADLKRTKPSKSYKVYLDDKKTISVNFWNKTTKTYYSIASDKEILVMRSLRALDATGIGNPSFVNKQLSVHKNSTEALIQFADRNDEVLIFAQQ